MSLPQGRGGRADSSIKKTGCSPPERVNRGGGLLIQRCRESEKGNLRQD